MRPPLDQITVVSAGTIALNGNLSCDEAVHLMQLDHGVDISRYRARSFTTDIQADHRGSSSGRRYRTHRDIRDYVGTGEEVDDPYGGPPSAYRRALRNLDRLVTMAINRIEADTTAG